MVDKITAVGRSRLGTQIGVLDDANVLRLNRALVVFLGIATSTRYCEFSERGEASPAEPAAGTPELVDALRVMGGFDAAVEDRVSGLLRAAT
jgi:hypothetical protein